ncbi:MAG: cyclic pyranopterin monophosphate synthase MoaC [Verrucomicrobia bacterium]|nr:cyclic pyranopterin monophosphate synthase MoaC [Verrucomicrobiota bacterium]MBV8484413.1 cyclic pyranopterin monophosphate synthase MoaC [Verrucomicrobiota bacterium]
MSSEFTHIGPTGTVRMVDVSQKPVSRRIATARGHIRLQRGTIQKINQSSIAKGNVLAVAQVAAVSAVKRTDELIPLCHSLPVQHVDITFHEDSEGFEIECAVTTVAQTGVEMEALTGVAVAALTIYDMCKAVDKTMEISDVRLVSKTKESI